MFEQSLTIFGMGGVFRPSFRQSSFEFLEVVRGQPPLFHEGRQEIIGISERVAVGHPEDFCFNLILAPVQFQVEDEPLTFADMFQRDSGCDLKFSLREFQPLRAAILVHVFSVDDEHTTIPDLLHHFGSGCQESRPPVCFPVVGQEDVNEVDIHDVDQREILHPLVGIQLPVHQQILER